MKRQFLVRLLLIISFTIPFLFSFPVWFSNRLFPAIPLYGNIFNINTSLVFDSAILGLFFFSALWFLFYKTSKGGLLFFIIYTIYCVLDQTRIQPFFFEIAIIIGLYYVFRSDFKSFKIAFLLVMSGTYIWSGIHKVNPVFFEFWLNGLNKRIPFIPLQLRQLITWCVPFMEMLFGLGLIFKLTRKYAIIFLAIMHAMIIITLTISHSGLAVMPLNIINPFLLIFLCWNLNWSIVNLKSNHLKLKIIMIYALVLPALNLIGLYDHLLAFSYFSGKPDYCNIIFKDSKTLEALPKDIKDLIRTHNSINYININDWSLRYTNLLCYPEDRVYNYLQYYIENFTGHQTTQLQYYKK